jgi:hypothetical protein
MGLDIRLPIGGMFLIFGMLLSVFGAFSDSSIYQRSLGLNINLRWGLVLIGFGLCMLFLGVRAMKSRSRIEVNEQREQRS